MWWHEPTRHTPDGEGFWSVATYAEVLAVLNDPRPIRPNGRRPALRRDLLQDLEIAGVVLNMMDDPRHARIRRLVTRPHSGRRPGLENELRRRMRAMSRGWALDFLHDVAAELPMQAICLLLGVPEGDRHLLFEAVEHIFDIPDESDFLA